MGEDRSRIRCNPSLFARLRSFAFNILKTNRRSSLSQDRYRAAIGGLDYLLRICARNNQLLVPASTPNTASTQSPYIGPMS